MADRGDRTRQLILDTALRLFRTRGYDKTTMRAIAGEAGLSPGNAYYYFPSKQHLVQDFYREIQVEHRRRATAALRERDLGARLAGVLHAGIDTMAPYHGFAASFIKVAIEPGSPLSPFSAESAPARDDAIGLFADALEGPAADPGPRLAPRLRAELPRLLWLGYLAVTLFWVHDRSPDQARTRALIDRAAPLVPRLLTVARLPVARGAVRGLLDLTRLGGEPA